MVNKARALGLVAPFLVLSLLNIAPAIADNPWQRFVDAISGHVILQSDGADVQVAICNRSTDEIGVTLSYAAKSGQKATSDFVDPGYKCKTEGFHKNWFTDGLPAKLTIAAMSPDGHTQGSKTLLVAIGDNAVVFGSSHFCDSYSQPHDPRNGKPLPNYGCAELQR